MYAYEENTVGLPHGPNLCRLDMLGTRPLRFYVNYQNDSYQGLWDARKGPKKLKKYRP